MLVKTFVFYVLFLAPGQAPQVLYSEPAPSLEQCVEIFNREAPKLKEITRPGKYQLGCSMSADPGA